MAWAVRAWLLGLAAGRPGEQTELWRKAVEKGVFKIIQEAELWLSIRGF